jgi:hypothetical protein
MAAFQISQIFAQHQVIFCFLQGRVGQIQKARKILPAVSLYAFRQHWWQLN